jgi:hypothetical protein
MRRVMARSLAATVMGVLAAGGVALLGSSAASASASDYSGAQFQITWSLNCTNRAAACATDPNLGGGPGGFWGWVALIPSNTPGTGSDSGQETVCGHSLVPGAGPGGAFHTSFDSTWNEFSSPNPPGPVTDPNGNYLAINDPFSLFPVPATYGHYHVSFEGATGEITVAP